MDIIRCHRVSYFLSGRPVGWIGAGPPRAQGADKTPIRVGSIRGSILRATPPPEAPNVSHRERLADRLGAAVRNTDTGSTHTEVSLILRWGGKRVNLPGMEVRW